MEQAWRQFWRKWASALAVLALLLSSSAPMGPMFMADQGGNCSRICCPLDQPDDNGGTPSPVGHGGHHCDLCQLHCSLGWMPPSSDGQAVRHARVANAEPNFVSIFSFSPFGDFNPVSPRAPPARA